MIWYIHKIDQLITTGSPIDKIHYYFESTQLKYAYFSEIVNEVRGDLGETPFRQNGRPHIHWMNFWDRGDVVSGTLETPNSFYYPDDIVDNHRVSNCFFPDPIRSHSRYFRNKQVMEKIFNIIFHQEYSYRTIMHGRNPVIYHAHHLEPSKRYIGAFIMQGLVYIVVFGFWNYIIYLVS